MTGLNGAPDILCVVLSPPDKLSGKKSMKY